MNQSKVIQLGISISKENGETPKPISTWQFNFHFDKKTDDFNKESITLLEKAGLNFEKHEQQGIPHQVFGEYFFNSGFVLNDNLKWVAFNSAFDFGYLLKMLTNAPLPATEAEFLKELSLYFPIFYDVKHLRMDDGDLNS